MNESALHLLAEFINLVIECEHNNCVEESSIDIKNSYLVINDYLDIHGYSEEEIKQIWSGEHQLTSS